MFRGAAAGPGAANALNITNLNTTLVAAFGAEWASDPEIYAGLCAAWGSSNTSSVLQNGDPNRTLYVSRSRIAVGTVGLARSATWSLTNAGDGAMTSGASGIIANNNPFDLYYDAQQTVALIGISGIDDQNPFLIPGVQGPAFNEVFGGGVQQVGSAASFGTFGPAGPVEFALDLYRIQARNNIAGQVTGTNRVGSYEGTVTVNASGVVAFISQDAASSAYDSWMSTFTSIMLPADKLAGADPDKDEIENVLEFVLNGNPSVSGQAILPTLDASGANFVFNFTRRADSAGEVSQVFEYSVDLADWTTNSPVAIPVASGTSGFATVGASTGTAPNQVQAVTVTIPKGANTKLFGRLRAVK
jgi:hypothetical protein